MPKKIIGLDKKMKDDKALQDKVNSLKLLTIRNYAEKRGCVVSYIHKLIQENRVTRIKVDGVSFIEDKPEFDFEYR